ncbi:hypothetical protein SAMN05443637_10284 [Pseudonocardia thermophila]|jgi:hypothetical protein|uniref:Uncharacterized protein n=1 Tax=Pseudonocardia thermophila TaxID=1848 RepID=A0A1M6P738_PSETH|nr:hypothetical protein [Pseudonocardia thermophila]SHK03718.1 hypothetical protein SAMN05443637_10284 [Pseudonocardia thermophila]
MDRIDSTHGSPDGGARGDVTSTNAPAATRWLPAGWDAAAALGAIVALMLGPIPTIAFGVACGLVLLSVRSRRTR